MLSRTNLFLQACERKLVTPSTIRHFTSPAVRRYNKKQENRAKPTLDIARSMPVSIEEMDNHTLLTVAALHNHGARVEVLKRHIMCVDECSYDEASKTFDMIAKKNREGMWMVAFPYQIGISLGVISAFVSIPMVFDLNTTLWFNEFFVTTEVPGKEDLETGLEVGAWAWNWMEPPLGTLSFVLLCLQYSRAQMSNLGIKPYTITLKKWRGRNLANEFPQYNPDLIMDFSETDPLMKVVSPS
eukprot:Nitzschia sp. Nitz4//scaffold2_size372955//176921//177713//NITZ4_000423-RA/size372955-snap-gene-0.81-mRNA-1//-1//CDS//3329546778//6518//frame0